MSDIADSPRGARDELTKRFTGTHTITDYDGLRWTTTYAKPGRVSLGENTALLLRATTKPVDPTNCTTVDEEIIALSRSWQSGDRQVATVSTSRCEYIVSYVEDLRRVLYSF